MATNNSLLQFAQVITDHHYDPSPPSPQRVRSESSPHPTLRSENSRLDHRRSYLPIRKVTKTHHCIAYAHSTMK